jgi:DNA-binding NarL/FixJ family response regulator
MYLKIDLLGFLSCAPPKQGAALLRPSVGEPIIDYNFSRRKYMPKNEFQIAIVEDDPFSRNWMALLAARDWRTRVAGEFDEPLKIIPLLQKKASYIDLILLDIDIPSGEDWIPQILKAISGISHPPAILCTGIGANPDVLGRLIHSCFVGYLLKNEINYSLAWAIDIALSGKWVITESVRSLASAMRFPLPHPCVILDGRKTLQSTLSKHQAEVSRLAFLFSMERRELADELGIVEDWSYGLVSQIYEQLGVKDILNDDEDLQSYFGDQPLILSHVEKIRAAGKNSAKAHDLETLAFHIITMPEMVDLP